MGPHGLYEHAEHTRPRPEHGYCTDDNARLLIVSSREPDQGVCAELSRRALDFVLDAQVDDGRVHNRRDNSGGWTDEPGTDDCWGRTVWSLGVAARHHDDVAVRASAAAGFDTCAAQRSAYPHSMAFAALGAADILAIDPENPGARALALHALAVIGPPLGSDWCWPEVRLTYANAALAEAVIAAGAALGSETAVDRGLLMLGWLLDVETRFGHLSVAPAGGCAEVSREPRFDQQPLEAAALADACVRASAVTGDHSWLEGIGAAVRWFEGHNDAGLPMYDPESGGSFDGLHATSVNRNQGAESTLALVSTRQCARTFVGSL